MPSPKLMRVASLVDLPRSPQSGGHVKCWERLAAAAVQGSLPLDLTVYFSGPESMETLGPYTRIRQLPPVFSTTNLKFLPYVPDHTDLANFHPRLGQELKEYDLIHTTDGFFAFTKTAERVSHEHHIPLVTSFHTDTPSYTRIFTQQTIEKTLGWIPRLSRSLIENWRLPEKQADKMEKKLERHVARCSQALVTRQEDHALAEKILGKDRVHHLRLGVDKTLFGPFRRDRAGIERDYGIPPGRTVVLFVGRVDVGKNIYTLVEAMEKAIRQGKPLHLVTAGIGPALDEVRHRLAGHVSTPGYIKPSELARLYASVDVLGLCSEVEIRSMAAVEAIASGCPVLTAEKNGVWELFHHTPAMQAIGSDDEDWRRALEALAAAPEKLKAMREAALTYSRDYLASWQDVLAEDVFAVWEKVLQEQRSAAA